MRIGLTYDRKSSNTDVARELSTVSSALATTGCELTAIGCAADLIDKLAAGQRFDLVLNLCRESTCSASSVAQVPAMLGAMQIPVAFAAVESLCLCSHRGYMKSILRERGVPTSDYWMIETLDDLRRIDTTYPVTATSVFDRQLGTARPIADSAELSKVCCHLMSQADQSVIVEPCLTGATYCVGILGSGSAAMAMLPTELLASGDTSLANTARRTAQAAWRVLGGLDAGCVTLQVDNDGQMMVRCVDAVPCMLEGSPLMQAAAAAGLSAEQVILRIYESACHRAPLHHGHAPSDLLKPHMAQSQESEKSSLAPRK